MTDEQLLRYSRHILLPAIGIEGQERILAAHALVVGAGGLGSPAALYLASAGVGRITLADDDNVDLTNLQRQILHTDARVGMAKAEAIVSYREKNGPFKGADDLVKVKGLGKKLIEQNRANLRFESEKSPG